MDRLSEILATRGWDKLAIGVEMDNYWFSAAAFASLQRHLPNARFADATALVNWQRAVKSETEIAYMRKAPPGSWKPCMPASSTRSRWACANAIWWPRSTMRASAAWRDPRDASAATIPPSCRCCPRALDASAPHLTWDERPMLAGEGTFFEIAGCYNRYHCPLSRTVFLGKPPQDFLEAEKATLEGMEAGLEAARPGNTCEDVANAFFAVLAKYGIIKDNRTGYSIGLSYPPDWGERTMSLRPGDRTELQARHDLPFHDRAVAGDDGARDHRIHPDHRNRARVPRRRAATALRQGLARPRPGLR
jgi:ectoine hydrolase